MSQRIMPKVFLWMCIGLAITFVTGSIISNNPSAVLEIFKGRNVFILAVVEVILVIWLSARITKMSALSAKIMFILYSFVSGLTFSSIFIVYEISSIIYVFLATSIIMLVFALLGYFIKLDLTKLGTYLFMAIIGVLIMMIINLFVRSESFSIGIAIISVVIFVAYIAYDVQKIKHLFESNALPEDNLAIYGALQLYLDFINIFIDLLRIFGRDN
jgi:hypothetical protein